MVSPPVLDWDPRFSELFTETQYNLARIKLETRIESDSTKY
jgi:hypothetical protein